MWFGIEYLISYCHVFLLPREGVYQNTSKHEIPSSSPTRTPSRKLTQKRPPRGSDVNVVMYTPPSGNKKSFGRPSISDFLSARSNLAFEIRNPMHLDCRRVSRTISYLSEKKAFALRARRGSQKLTFWWKQGFARSARAEVIKNWLFKATQAPE